MFIFYRFIFWKINTLLLFYSITALSVAFHQTSPPPPLTTQKLNIQSVHRNRSITKTFIFFCACISGTDMCVIYSKIYILYIIVNGSLFTPHLINAKYHLENQKCYKQINSSNGFLISSTTTKIKWIHRRE